MDEELKRAAQSGDIDALYTLIHNDSNIFKCIDELEFIDTPLHIAAVSGNTGFAMEMMNLKPSFARKLNRDGLSPIHLALLNQQTEMVIDFLSVDKDLIRVKGREGHTILHHVARGENVHLLSRILDICPDCILDLTFWRQTALHVAAENNEFQAFKAMLEWIQRAFEYKRSERSKILNLQDKDGNTVLHLAASNNQPQMIKLLIENKEVNKNKTNQHGYTAMDVLERQTLADTTESVNILNSNARRYHKYFSEFETVLGDQFREMKPEVIGALLVVFALVLTMTYQAILSPPGGVYQADAGGSNKLAGKSVMDPIVFVLFYLPNWLAFLISWVITMSLFEAVANRIMSFLWPLYIVMCFCYGVGITTIAPSTTVGNVAIVPALIIVYIFFYTLSRRFRKYYNGDA